MSTSAPHSPGSVPSRQNSQYKESSIDCLRGGSSCVYRRDVPLDRVARWSDGHTAPIRHEGYCRIRHSALDSQPHAARGGRAHGPCQRRDLELLGRCPCQLIGLDGSIDHAVPLCAPGWNRVQCLRSPRAASGKDSRSPRWAPALSNRWPFTPLGGIASRQRDLRRTQCSAPTLSCFRRSWASWSHARHVGARRRSPLSPLKVVSRIAVQQDAAADGRTLPIDRSAVPGRAPRGGDAPQTGGHGVRGQPRLPASPRGCRLVAVRRPPGAPGGTRKAPRRQVRQSRQLETLPAGRASSTPSTTNFQEPPSV